MANMTIMTNDSSFCRSCYRRDARNDSVILRTTTQKNSAPVTRYAACPIVEMQGTTP